jgi:hypothetical protein
VHEHFAGERLRSQNETGGAKRPQTDDGADDASGVDLHRHNRSC